MTPAVGFSHWFNEEGAECTSNVRYFYNGCDVSLFKFENQSLINSHTMTCYGGNNGEGLVESRGSRLKKNETFSFSFEGLHGYQHATRPGYARNASVEVDCRAVNGKVYYSNCGEFYVGQTQSCTQDIVI